MIQTNRKVYGILTLVWMLVFVLLLSAIIGGFGPMNNGSSFIYIVIGGLIAIASMAAIIRTNDDTIVISSAMPFIAKKVVVYIDDIEKLEIEPSIYSGTTSYKFYLRNNRFVETYGKLLKVERKRLLVYLKSRGVNVVLNTFT